MYFDIFSRKDGTVLCNYISAKETLRAWNDFELNADCLYGVKVWCNGRYTPIVDKQYFEDNYISKVFKPMTEPLDNNPKTLAAQSKPKLSDVPPVALFAMGAAMSDGAAKYGKFNWRDTSVTASVFYDAILRHLTAWYNGENHATDSKVHHLGHIMASCAILLDAERHAVFNDDRDTRDPRPNAKPEWMDVTV